MENSRTPVAKLISSFLRGFCEINACLCAKNNNNKKTNHSNVGQMFQMILGLQTGAFSITLQWNREREPDHPY